MEKQFWFQSNTAKTMKKKSVTPTLRSVSSNLESDLASNNESVLLFSTNSDNGKIPKPDGEPGRLGRGGYNSERAVDWPAKDYKRLKV